MMRSMELNIIYRDEHYIAINKPSGLLVHRSPIDRHETRFVVQMLRDQIGQHVYPVHRLDKPTSGVLIFGLSRDAAARLQPLFRNSQVEKTYLALVRGYTPEELFIDHPVKAVKDKKAIGRVTDAKPAQTRLRTLACYEIDAGIEKYPQSRYSLVQLQPLTGRRHQLRYHMKHISHPIIGDAKYGRGAHNRYFQQHFSCHRLLLAAVSLRFQHPFSGEHIHIQASPGTGFLNVLEQLAH